MKNQVYNANHHNTLYFFTSDDALVSVYRVHLFPDPANKWDEGVLRREGFFYVLSNKRDPERLLAKASEREVMMMVLHELGEIGKILRFGDTRARFEVNGYSWRGGEAVKIV